MKIFIQCGSDGTPFNINAFCAMKGFEQMGFETVLFCSPKELNGATLSDIVVGGVGIVKTFLQERGITVKDIDYPAELSDHYGRKIWDTTVKQLTRQNYSNPIFVKPQAGKLFNGFVYQTARDLIGRIAPGQNAEIYCSEVISIKTEWRCYVRYGEILDIRKYKGELGIIYDLLLVRRMIAEYTDAPQGYALDIGVTCEGKTVIIEVNDGYSLGSYGLDPLLYAKLLSARWAELTGGIDECDF